jgi:sulfite reductase (NADPH) flavoprotein alpha-component
MTKVPFIPENAPFDAAQRLWLNGFLAGLFAHEVRTTAAASAAPAAGVPLVIVYGSQTGTAEALARRIATQAKTRGHAARVVDAAAHATVDWRAESHLLVVTSTYGDGDMPDNAQGFWDWLQTDAASALSHLKFSVLALGDTNYEHFCAAGKKFDERLEKLGATRIHPLAECELDYETTAKSWTEGVLSVVGGKNTGSEQAATAPVSAPEPARAEAPASWSKTNPFPARLVVNRLLNSEGSGKETRHIEITLSCSDLTYEAGDALGVYPTNCPALVGELLSRLGCDGEEAVAALGGGEISLRKALSHRCDITKPGPELLRRVAENNPALAELLAPEHKEDLKKWLWGREVIDLLLETPSLTLTPADFAGLLKPLAPRLYSISSSPRAHAGQVHLTVSVVRHTSHGRMHKGVCSSFLADRATEPAVVPVFVQRSAGFRLPVSGDTPIIMVGPGTGIAPFRAFLHERRALGAQGKSWLFFGEQHAAKDFYYRDELEALLANGGLTKLSTAFSRDQAEKIYVQHRLLENAAEVWSWLQSGAHFYVCGDASRMAKDVDAAMHQVAIKGGGLTTAAAAEYVLALKTAKRYQRDVY